MNIIGNNIIGNINSLLRHFRHIGMLKMINKLGLSCAKLRVS
jgi:hypothetical protein